MWKQSFLSVDKEGPSGDLSGLKRNVQGNMGMVSGDSCLSSTKPAQAVGSSAAGDHSE